MDADIAQAVSTELNFLLRPGWVLLQESDRFRVTAPPGDRSEGKELLRDEVWRIAQFVAYTHFISIAKDFDGTYTIASRMESGKGFEIVFEAMQ